MPVMLYSGGLDSLVLATDLLKNPFRYGINEPLHLLHFTAPDKVHQWCTKLLMEKQLPWLRECGDLGEVRTVDYSSFIFTRDARHPQPKDYVRLGFGQEDYGITPSRNLIFLGIAFNLAAALRCEEVIVGFLLTPRRWRILDGLEYSACVPQDDDDPRFVEAIRGLRDLGGILPEQRLMTPFLDRRTSKGGVIKLGRSLGCPMHLTHSCTWSAPKPCGKCAICRAYKNGCREAGFDPRAAKGKGR